MSQLHEQNNNRQSTEQEYRQKQKEAFRDSCDGFPGDIPPELRQAFGMAKKIIQPKPTILERELLGPLSSEERALIRAHRVFIQTTLYEQQLAEAARSNPKPNFPTIHQTLAQITTQARNKFLTARFGVIYNYQTLQSTPNN